MTRDPCATCGRIHSIADALAVDRFSTTPTTYRATYPGAPIRATRAEAQADACQWRAGAA